MLPKEAVMRLFLRERPDIEETEVEIEITPDEVIVEEEVME